MSNLIQNVRSVIVDGGKKLWFALQPIKKGDMLFDCYKVTFFEMDKSIRYPLISQCLKRNCKCIACTENWPAVLAPNGRVMSFEDMAKIVVDVTKKSDSGKYLILLGDDIKYDQTIVNDLIKIMNVAFTYTKQPSQELCAMICILRFVFDRMHGTKLRILDKCRKK